MLALQSTTHPAGPPRPMSSQLQPRRLAAAAAGPRQQQAGSTEIAAAPPAVALADSQQQRQQHVAGPAAASASDTTSGTRPAAGAPSTTPPAGSGTGGSSSSSSSSPGGLAGLLSPEAWGKLCLLGVAALWGSYNPMLRLAYSQDGPPGPVAIMLFRGVLQAVVLVTAYRYFGSTGSSSGNQAGEDDAPASCSSAGSSDNSSSEGSSSISGGTAAALGEAEAGADPATGGGGWMGALTSRFSFTAIAATELGTWLFLATSIQTLGLQLTTATRAGFLIQATALLTPLLASLSGDKPSRNVWAGCIVALAGCLAIAADASATDPDDASALSLGGDVAILASALFFSLATVRLGTYARAIPAVELAAAKSTVLGGAALGTFLVAAAMMATAGEPLSDLWPGWDSSPVAWAVLCYAALGPGALAAFLHAKGQSVVPPADAQVIFSTVPLWSIAFAFLLLGGEPLSEKTLLGGAAVVAAGIIASRKPAAPPAEQAPTGKGGKQA